MTDDQEIARKNAKKLADEYSLKYLKAIKILDEALEDALIFLSFP